MAPLIFILGALAGTGHDLQMRPLVSASETAVEIWGPDGLFASIGGIEIRLNVPYIGCQPVNVAGEALSDKHARFTLPTGLAPGEYEVCLRSATGEVQCVDEHLTHGSRCVPPDPAAMPEGEPLVELGYALCTVDEGATALFILGVGDPGGGLSYVSADPANPESWMVGYDLATAAVRSERVATAVRSALRPEGIPVWTVALLRPPLADGAFSRGDDVAPVWPIDPLADPACLAERRSGVVVLATDSLVDLATQPPARRAVAAHGRDFTTVASRLEDAGLCVVPGRLGAGGAQIGTMLLFPSSTRGLALPANTCEAVRTLPVAAAPVAMDRLWAFELRGTMSLAAGSATPSGLGTRMRLELRHSRHDFLMGAGLDRGLDIGAEGWAPYALVGAELGLGSRMTASAWAGVERGPSGLLGVDLPLQSRIWDHLLLAVDMRAQIGLREGAAWGMSGGVTLGARVLSQGGPPDDWD